MTSINEVHIFQRMVSPQSVPEFLQGTARLFLVSASLSCALPENPAGTVVHGSAGELAALQMSNGCDSC